MGLSSSSCFVIPQRGLLSMGSPYMSLDDWWTAIRSLAPCLTAGLTTVTFGSVAPRCSHCSLRCGEDKETFERFSRYADAMLDDSEFFIRKAIGWVLRDTAKKRPDLVYRWLLPRSSRASGVTIREAVKPLSIPQREAVLAAR